MADTDRLVVDPETLRASVREKYREVAARPAGDFHFHTGRPLAALLGYDRELVDSLPDRAVESFAGVANPLTLRPLAAGERVVDLGSGAGFDCFVAAETVGPDGRVVGVDMTPEMLDKARETARQLGLDNVEFLEGIIEDLPVDDGWADVVTSNGVLNLVADKRRAMRDLPGAAPRRCLRLRRHRGRQGRAGRGRAQHRPVDRLHRGWAVAGRLAATPPWRWVRPSPGRTRARHLRRGPGRENVWAYDVVARAFLAHRPA